MVRLSAWPSNWLRDPLVHAALGKRGAIGAAQVVDAPVLDPGALGDAPRPLHVALADRAAVARGEDQVVVLPHVGTGALLVLTLAVIAQQSGR